MVIQAGPVGRGLLSAVGGRARLRVTFLLAAVLALQGADTATIGAAATQLEPGLHIGNTQLGLLVTVSAAVGAVATLPFGALADRVERVPMLTTAIFAWALALAVSGAAQSFDMLLITRLGLGVVVAVTGPVVASLVGDLFPSADRGRLYGFVLAGELLGGGLGFLVCGNVAALASWRWAFWVMVAPSLALAWALHRWLPEPARGGASVLQDGAESIVTVESVEGVAGAEPVQRGNPAASHDLPEHVPDALERQIDKAGIKPFADRVLQHGAKDESLWAAVRYVVTTRTNLTLIVASALGYFVFAGVQTFGVIFVQERFAVGQSLATALLITIGAGAIIGVLTSGRIADALLARGRLSARPVVAGIAFVGAVLVFVPALLVPTLLMATPLLITGAAMLGATNPPLDAARLDLMPARLWGRAEAVRTVLRTSLQALAPLSIGWTATQFGSPTSGYGHPAAHVGGNATGLQYAFLLALVPVAVAAVLLLTRARAGYPRDVATALASDRAAREGGRRSG